ncbi:MAG TPA: formylglycine-generating enzyme family protein [Coleofasciculaceae cyanobacterium]|jgi:formylglycine-generating enzyme required for sulfatase activity
MTLLNRSMREVPSSPTKRLVISRQRHRGQFFPEPLNETTRLDMMQIPGGTFLMGSPPDELDNYSDEQPQHEVTVPAFFMARTPITQAQWQAVATYPIVESDLDANPSHFKGDNRPVEQVSWDDATEFCQRLSQRTGRTYQLPSEAEWEYACRAGTTTPFHFGETLSDELANYCAQDREINGTLYKGVYGRGILGQYREETTDVGQFPANPFGLYDMHGNVLEWCEDDWHNSYEGAPNDGSAWVESDRTETDRLLRGGSWYFLPRNCRSAYRSNRLRDDGDNIIGFRVCCVPPRLSS